MNETFNEYLSSTSIATTATMLPDFGSFHENYTKSVARGRNPKSIPRNSELWYHTKNSNERRDRIAKVRVCVCVPVCLCLYECLCLCVYGCLYLCECVALSAGMTTISPY